MTRLASVLVPVGRLFLLCFSGAEPSDQAPTRVTRQEAEDALACGWVVESIVLPQNKVRPTPNDGNIRAGRPKAWHVAAKSAG